MVLRNAKPIIDNVVSHGPSEEVWAGVCDSTRKHRREDVRLHLGSAKNKGLSVFRLVQTYRQSVPRLERLLTFEERPSNPSSSSYLQGSFRYVWKGLVCQRP